MRLGKYDFVTISLIATIGHGIVFSFIQLYEYNVTSFSISDSVFGAIFYLTTGFHGLHVIIGTILLIVCLLRHLAMHFSKEHHVGFLCAV
jgi:heme/copper-type cytochrome/quinol oxidase subunit 3